jgi:hypothetical protein
MGRVTGGPGRSDPPKKNGEPMPRPPVTAIKLFFVDGAGQGDDHALGNCAWTARA